MFVYQLFFIILFFSKSFSNSHNSCLSDQSFQYQFRTEYEIGDTLSIEDQNAIYPVCNGSGEYETGDLFSFADMNGNLNGGNYKITLISMNATW